MITLVPFARRHLANTLRWINEPEVAKPFAFDRRISSDMHEQWFQRVQDDLNQAVFAIEDDRLGHIGNMGLKDIQRRNRQAELWVYIGEAHARGRGIGREAVRLLQEEAFVRRGLCRLILHVFPHNKAAIRVYEHCGFAVEGLLRHSVETTAGSVDMLLMSCLKQDIQPHCSPSVTLMQPTFLSWLGYFELLDVADTFVFLDDFQVSRQSWSQRNKLFLCPGKVGLLSLPLRRDVHCGTFLQVRPAVDARWKKKFLASVRSAYAKAPYMDRAFDLLEPWLADEYSSLADMLIAFTLSVAQYLGLLYPEHSKTILRSSNLKYDRTLCRSNKVKALLETLNAGCYYSPRGSFSYMREDGVFPLERCPVYFQNHVPVPYPQTGVQDFVPYLSIVDALCHLSPSGIREIIRGTRRWDSWHDMAVVQQDSALEPDSQHIE